MYFVDCTNYFFEFEETDDLRRYGKSKQHQPLPLVGMGLFMYYGLEQIIVCTDAGLLSKTNRKFNDISIGEKRVRSFITTQSVKKLPAYLKEFALASSGWRLTDDNKVYDLNELDEKRILR